MDGCLAAGQPAAQHNDSIANLFLLPIVIVHQNDIVILQTKNGRLYRQRTHSDNQSVRLQGFYQFRCDLCIQTKLRTGILRQFGQGVAQLIHLIFKGDGLFLPQNAAESIGFFAEQHLMSPLRRCLRGLQTAGATACDQHLFPLGCGNHFCTVHFPANKRIDSTAAGGSHAALCHAGKAAQTMDNVLLPIGHDLAGQLMIGQQRTSHIDQIGLTGGDDFFHLRGIIQPAQRSNRHCHVFFDFRSQIDIDTMRQKHGRMGPAKSLLIRAGRNMQNIHIRLQQLSNLDALLQCITSVKKFIAAHAEFNRKAGAYRFAHSGQHFLRQTDTIFQAAAISVRAVIKIGRQKLIEEPAVAAVHHNHLKTAAFRQRSHIGVGLCDLLQHIHSKCLHRTAIGTGSFRWSPLANGGLFTFILHIGTGVLTGMG